MKAPQRINLFLLLALSLGLPVSWYFVRAGQSYRPTVLPKMHATAAAAAVSPALAQATTPNATIIRTIVYRQITDFQNGGSVGAIHNLKISADGAKIIFLSGRKVFTMDATGQNLREIYDAPNPATDRAPDWVDISANGSKVIWAAHSARTIFSANADGSNRIPVAPTFQNPFGTEALVLNLNPALTADGARIIFTHSGSTADVTGGYRVNLDGSERTMLFSQRQLAGLFGTDPNAYNNNVLFRDKLTISADGSRLVFGTYNFQAAGHAVVWDRVTGLRKLTDFLGLADEGIALSSDGGKVTVIRRFPDRTSVMAINFDGNNQLELARITGDGPKLFGMPSNGAQVLANLGGASNSILPLINTDGSGQLDLVALGDCDVDPWRGAGGGLSGSLAGDGRRFAFRTTPGGLPHQLWVADINPVSVGDAPAVSEVNFNPNYVVANRSTSSTFTLRASGGVGGLRKRTCGSSFRNGNYAFRAVTGGASFGISLYDDATNGDPTANDGSYTQNRVLNDLALPDAVNPLQIRANVITNSTRQITAVDATPFFVLATAPGGSGPRLDSITPSSGAAGIQVKLTGSGFDPVAANNIVLFGNRQAVVKTATADRTMLEVIVPPDLSPGVVAVTVTVAAQTSNAVNFTVTGGTGGGVTLNDHRITGGPIPGACEPPVAKASFAPTDAQAIQWTFVSGFQNGAVIRWEWVQPNGTIYTQHEAPVNNPNSHVCFWNGIEIAGQPAASLPGNWQVRVFYNGTLLTTDNFTITAAPACTYSISPTNQSFGANGGTGSVTVTTQPGCAWTATSNASFVTINSGTPGNGSGTLNYTVAVNTSTAQRSGTMTIAGQTFTINQSGTAAGTPLIRIEPTTLSFNAARGQSLTVAAAPPRAPEPINIQRPKTEAEQKREADGKDHADQRRDWFYRQRQYPFDQIPDRARERAIAEKVQAQARMRFAATEAATEAVAAQWTHIGPSVTTSGAWGRVSGRVTSIIVHPTNPGIVYISGAQGGVWRTTDNGATWMALTDDQPSLAMGALAFDPNNPSVLYAGTGEQNFSLDSYYGNGVLKSTNGGVTWSVLGAATFARQTISRIVVSPSNSQVVFAASNNGLFRSTDGGNTWVRVLAGVATDVIATPGSGSVFYSAIHSSGVFKSTDGGVNWTKLTTGLPTSNFGRIHLTISVAAPNTLLASFTARDNKLEGLYRSTDAGANWTKLTNTPNVFGGQGWYNVSLGLHPTNTNVIYFGGLSLWRSLDGGANWTNVSNPRDYFLDVHPDQHAVAFNPQNPSVIWIGNDGGVWRSDNGGDTWLSRNDGLSLTQFQTVALHPTNDALAFGGTQDNGIQKYTGNSEWRETRTGDNGSTFFDFNTPTTIYSTYVLGSMIKSFSAGEPGTWAGATNGIPFTNGNADGRSAFYAPFTMSLTNPLHLAYGSYRVWYTTDGMTNWNAISSDVTGGGVIMAITMAANGSRIWTGSSDAQVWRGDLSGSSWSFTSVTKAPLPNRAITRIAAHPSDPQTAYISYSGFGTDHVFKTTDGGTTWTSANSGLPDIPVNVVLVDPNNPGTVYAGTDIGVYRSTEAGQNWMPFGTGLPNVAVFDLALRKNSNVLRAATHGRGMWDIQATGEQSFTIFNDGDATLSVTGITKQNNAAWLSFTTPSNVPFDIPPKGSVPVRVAVNATGLAAGLYTERLLVTSNDATRSPYPTGVFINLNVTGDGNGGGCTFTIAPTNQSFAASGGTGSVNVTAPNGCTWTAKANEDWITITANASGSGNGTVNFSVAANTSATSRGGTITIAGQTFAVTQTGGSNCTFTLAPASQTFATNGGAGTVNVTSQSGCNWTASSNAEWLTITAGTSGTGNGAVNYLVAANNSATTRSSTLTIAGQLFSVTQSGGSACAFTITPTTQTFSASGGNGSFNVGTQTNCNWTARTENDWIVITSGTSGSGGGTVNYRVAVNASPIPRAGFIVVAGQTFIVGQAGTGATCGLSPISIGQTVNGALVNTDCRSPIYGTNFYADLWYFTAKAGQQVALQLNSTEFDAYLALISPDGDLLDEDDDGGGGLNARIPITNGFVTLPQDGTYIIEASSASADELGKYTLSLTAPGGCTFAIAPSSQSIAASGGTGSVAVTSQTNCAWTAASNVDWITLTSGASGNGSGTVNYSVAANTSTSSRTGTITIAGQTFTVTQSGGSNCTFTIAPTSQNFAASGGTASINVTSQSGCNWTATSNADWLTITSGTNGSGNGVVNYSVAANTGAARSGTLTIAGQTFTVTQAANSSCTYTLAPSSQSFSNSGGSGNVNVTTSAGCAWTASTNAAWISLQTGSESGNGNGSIGYSVALNTSAAARNGTITIGGQTFTVNQAGAGATACVDVAISSSLTASTGSTLTVPISVSDLTGKGALSFDATITFDPAVLRLQSTPVDRTGTLSSAMTVTVNTSTPGQIRISAFNSAALVGAGTLLNLKFDVVGANGACSNLNWASFRFNEGTPCATTTNGRACVGSSAASLSGTVSYCVSPKAVPGVLLSANGSPNASATTASNGVFQLTGLGSGAYTLTPAKSGEVNGITSFDAALVALHVVGASTLNNCQQVAGDASNNGALSSFDAALIAQHVVGISNAANFAGTWKFVPPSRSYAALSGAQTNQNFDAVLVGDVSGNWVPSANLQSPTVSTNVIAQTTLALPTATAISGTTLTVPITVSNLTGENVIAYDLDVTFDPALLQPQTTPFDAAGTLSGAFTITANATAGRLRISAFGTTALAGAGTLLNLKFNVIGANATATLTWQKATLNEEALAQSNLTPGRVTVPRLVTTVSAADYKGPMLAAESIVSAFGSALATGTAPATDLPLPTTLAGTTVKVRDSAGTERLAPLFYVSPLQINYLVPLGTVEGTATITVTSSDGTVSQGVAEIVRVVPAFFTANQDGLGAPAGFAIHVKPNGAQIREPLSRLDAASGKQVPAPIDLGPADETVILELYGTGLRGRSSQTAVSATISSVAAGIEYADRQPGFLGLDQVNLRVPRSLLGRGEVDLVLIVEGKPANVVRINVR